MDDYLEQLAGTFDGMDDGQRLDTAAGTASRLRAALDLIRAGQLDAPNSVHAGLTGAVVALEAITSGRDSGSDGNG